MRPQVLLADSVGNMMKKEDISQGKLLIVITDSFLTSGEDSCSKRQVHIQMGEIIEIRYPYQWHFRTIDNKYFHAKPEMVANNCDYFGSVLEEVRWHNRADLSEILRLRLYSGNGNYFTALIMQGKTEVLAREIFEGKKPWFV